MDLADGELEGPLQSSTFIAKQDSPISKDGYLIITSVPPLTITNQLTFARPYIYGPQYQPAVYVRTILLA